MKRLIAILFLFFLLFNLFGYRLFIDYLQSQEQSQYSTINETKEDELISIKVAAALPPYTTASPGFEWVDGEVTVQGIIYRYVKRRISNDSIEYLCKPNFTKMRYQSAKDQFFQLCNDLVNHTSTQKDQHTPPVKPLFFEYWSACATYVPLAFFHKKNNYRPMDFILRHKEVVFALDHPPQAVRVSFF